MKAPISKKSTAKSSNSSKSNTKGEVSQPLPDPLSWNGQTWLERVSKGTAGGRWIFLGGSIDAEKAKKTLKFTDPHFQLWDGKKAHMFVVERLPVWVVPLHRDPGSGRLDHLEKTSLAHARDRAGSQANSIRGFHKDVGFSGPLLLEGHGLSQEEWKGILLGIGMAGYSYKRDVEDLPDLQIPSDAQNHMMWAIPMARSINLARHLVNMPGGTLNPESYADFVSRWVSLLVSQKASKGFKSHTTQKGKVEIEIWEGSKLEKEKMNLLRAVGQGAEIGPRLIVLSWTPQSSKAEKPVAIVGKGITFDSGGLNMKTGSGMRLMKKDMGGSAAAFGIFNWAVESALERPLKVFLTIAENAVGGASFRPGDVITSRAGISVEIHNTDAEGRLVLADALDLAQECEPSHLINLATLTGAIKSTLGADIAGLFANDDKLAEQLFEHGLATGDLAWRVPLFPGYKSQMRSHFADYINSPDGWGGAITAGLFLELFVKDVPWAHFDIYAWRDSAEGAWTETGGSGQGVALMASWLSQLKATAKAKTAATKAAPNKIGAKRTPSAKQKSVVKEKPTAKKNLGGR